MEVQAVIDRFEEDKAVLLLGKFEAQCIWPRTCLPSGVGEGDYLKICIIPDAEAGKLAQLESEELLKQLLGDNKA